MEHPKVNTRPLKEHTCWPAPSSEAWGNKTLPRGHTQEVQPAADPVVGPGADPVVGPGVDPVVGPGANAVMGLRAPMIQEC